MPELRFRIAAVALATAVASAGAGPSLDFRQQLAIEQLQRLIASSAYDSALTFAAPVIESATAGGDSLYLGALLVERGRAQLGVGNPTVAFSTLSTAETICQAQRDTTSWMTSLGMQSLALAYLGRYDEARARNHSRLELALAVGDGVSEAWARVGIAYDALLRGHYAAAKSEYEQAASRFRAAGAAREELVCLIGLGRALDSMGDTAGARNTYGLARDRARALGDTENEADALNNLGVIEYHHGDMATAAACFEEAWRLRSASSGPLLAVPMVSNVALVYAELGQYETAAQLLTEAIAAVTGLGGIVGPRVLSIELANVRHLQGRNRAAVRLYRSAIDGPGSIANETMYEAALGLSLALASMDSLSSAIAVIEQLRARDADQIVATRAGTDRMLASMYRRLGQIDTALLHAERAESLTREGQWQVRGPVLLELSLCLALAGRHQMAHGRFLDGVALMAEQRHATEDFSWREAMGARRYVALIDAAGILLQHPPGRSARERSETLFDTLQRFKSRTLLDRVSAPRDTTQGRSRELTPVTLAELQRDILARGDVLLDFSVGNDRTFVFAITRDSCRVLHLPGRRSSFPARTELFTQAMGNRPDPDTRSHLAGVDNAARVLGDILLGEVEDLLDGATRVIVVPDAFLSAVPFGALAPGGRPLIDRYEIVQAPTPGVLGNGSTPEAAGGSRIAVVTDKRAGPSFGEVRSLRRRFEGVSVASAPDSVAAMLESARGVIHVAAHIEVNDERPWRSGILIASVPGAGGRGAEMAPAGSGAPDAATRILAADILGLDIHSPLAVLAGCESGLGRFTHGEGVQGLTAAFLVAGVPTVVASLWRVDDGATRTLMEYFYRYLSTGQTVAASLRRAQVDVRQNGQTRHPYYWAGFIVVGNADTVIGLRERGPIARHGVQLLIIAAVAFAGFLVIRIRRNSRKPV